MDSIISFELETTGPIPGAHAILSLGAVCFVEGKETSSFYEKLVEPTKLIRDPNTMAWWEKYPKQLTEATKNPTTPAKIIPMFREWVMEIPAPRILAANSASQMGGHLWYYMNRFLGNSVIKEMFGQFAVLDIQTMLAATFDLEFSETRLDIVPDAWEEGLKISHHARDDARMQGIILVRALKQIQRLHEEAEGYEKVFTKP